ncbi:outer membrane protein [Rhodoplanes roseus]|nr:outer membrane beta-barrel protein [Rhodoplanes roseus]
MRRVLLAGVAFFAFAGIAAAADLPARMPVKAPPVAPLAWNWTGFYIGGYFGNSLAQSSATNAYRPGEVHVNDMGIAAGATVGYNFQFAPSWLIGIEGDFGILGTNREFRDFNDTSITVAVKTDWYGTLRGRFGYVTGPSLLYVTGGGAVAKIRETFGGDTGVLGVEETTTRWGWTVGAGIETKLARGWSTTAEYLYIDFGDNSFVGNPYGAAATSTFSNKAHVLKTGLNYKFGEGPFDLTALFASPLSSPARWSGFYAGVNAGLGISNVKVPQVMAPSFNGEENVNGLGFAGGGHIGYNYLAFSNWLVGVEGDFSYLGIDDVHGDWYDTSSGFGTKTDWYGTARVRVGTSTGPAYIYSTGGVAFAKLTNEFAGVTSSATKTGWTLGGGIETALDDRWSARVEYLYMDFGTNEVTSFGDVAQFQNRIQVVRGGLTYSFNTPTPVVARY